VQRAACEGLPVPLQRLLSALGVHDAKASGADRPFLRRLQDELSRRGAARLEYLAAFAGQLARVAGVEGGISDEETAAMAARLRGAAGTLSQADAALIAELLRHEREGVANVPAQELTRAINAAATTEEKQGLLDCLYAVAAADHLVSDAEEREIRRVAEAILVPHRVLMEIRGRYRDRIEALQNLPRHR
jgi:uncharacterized tellurite resistance protein B-like protein